MELDRKKPNQRSSFFSWNTDLDPPAADHVGHFRWRSGASSLARQDRLQVRVFSSVFMSESDIEKREKRRERNGS